MELEIFMDATAVRDQVAKVGRALAPRHLLSLIGLRYLAWFDENFRKAGAERPWAPLSPNTIAGRRGKGRGAQPLRDTGRMAQSFTHHVIGDESVWAGTRDQKAAWHHFGTKPHEITAKRARALVFQTPGGPVFRRRVMHPGIPARPLLPTKALAERLAYQVLQAYADEVTRQNP